MAAAGAVVGLPVGVAKEDVAQAGEEASASGRRWRWLLLDGCQQVFGAVLLGWVALWVRAPLASRARSGESCISRRFSQWKSLSAPGWMS